MKKFISVHDVTDINALVEKALMYKANPLKTPPSVPVNASAYCS